MAQLRLTDFTVLRVMLTAVVVSMLGVSFRYPRDLIPVKTKEGSVKNAVFSGLIFDAGFGLLGYCPGTIAGAVGSGFIDAATGGFIVIVLGTIIYAMTYKTLKDTGILTTDKYSGFSLFHQIKQNPFRVTLPIGAAIVVVMIILEGIGL